MILSALRPGLLSLTLSSVSPDPTIAASLGLIITLDMRVSIWWYIWWWWGDWKSG